MNLFGRHPVGYRVRAWMGVVLCLQFAACYSYSGALHVAWEARATPADRSSAPGYTDPELDVAREIVTQVAARFDMKDDPEIYSISDEMNERVGHPYELLVFFTRHDESAPTRAERAQINIGVDVRDDRSELIFWIRDLDHGGETDFTRAIKAELEALIRARFEGALILYQKDRISTFMSG